MQEKEEEGRKRGGGEGEGGVFDLFQRYYKLSECSCLINVLDWCFVMQFPAKPQYVN